MKRDLSRCRSVLTAHEGIASRLEAALAKGAAKRARVAMAYFIF